MTFVLFVEYILKSLFLYISNQRFPFDTKNLMGYLVAVVLEYLANVHLYCFVANLAASGIGGVLFTLSMTGGLKHHFNSIQKTLKTGGSQVAMYEKICHCVQSHSNIKQLSKSIL